jgi:hypothetical protein
MSKITVYRQALLVAHFPEMNLSRSISVYTNVILGMY